MSLPKLFDRGSDRRQAPRTKLDEIAYIGMGPENGGLVLDVSDGGLSFQSVAPVKPAETIRFLLSLRDESRIEGLGEVVWTNEARTLCGLKFTSLSSDARAHLISWTNASRTDGRTYKSPLTSSPPTAAHFRDTSAAPARRPNSAEPSVFAISPSGADSSSTAATRPLRPGPLLTWIMFGILAAALTVAAYRYGVHVGHLQAGSVEKPAQSGDAAAKAKIEELNSSGSR